MEQAKDYNKKEYETVITIKDARKKDTLSAENKIASNESWT